MFTDIPCSRNVEGLACDFSRDYELGRLPAMRELERNVLGCDYGGTSWTTRREAGRIAELLELCPGARLLDVGAGSGWPALFLAQITGCEVVLADIPLLALQIAIERATADGVRERCQAVVAKGAALPFQNNSFDNLSHSDVLCCMPAKLAMLGECRRVARPDAKMAFSVIAPAPNLSETERSLAVESGPPFVDVSADYEILLQHSRWRVLERIDVTAEYLQSLRTFLEEMEARTEALTTVLGREGFSERVKRRQATIAAIEKGVLKREIFVALTIAWTAPR